MIDCTSNERYHYTEEMYKCRKSVAYFLHTYCHIFDATAGAWVPFHLWPAQQEVLQNLLDNRLTVILKARQLGLTWLVLGFALWRMLFHPAATVLFLSRRDEEAVDLLKVRLHGVYDRLPPWLKMQSFVTDNDHEWHWSNGSRALAFPTTGGDSYSATLVIVDEADLVPDLGKLMSSVKPTIDAGGRMILVSRVDKSKPHSPFKRIYETAKQRLTEWVPIFLPWSARPDRDLAWYATQRADIWQRTGAFDELYEQYPATDIEALLPPTLDKRIPLEWLQQCYHPISPIQSNRNTRTPAIPGLEIYALPQPGKTYVIGADPAEGNPTSDESALVVQDWDTGEEVAALAARFEPSTFAAYIDSVGQYYNNALVMVERNNHGYAVLLWLQDHSRLLRLPGYDGGLGWLTNSRSKAMLYDTTADAFRNRETLLHSPVTFTQLASIEGSNLRAPEGDHDDRATAYALACQGRKFPIWPPTVKGPLLMWPDGPEDPGSVPEVVFDDNNDSWWRRP